jgi:hypothetical protein
MNDGDYVAAIDLLEPLIARAPLEYQNFTLLAAAYAGRAGVTVLDIVKAQLSRASDEDSSIFGMVLQVLPAGYTDAHMADVQAAINLLLRIPASRVGPKGDPTYGQSAQLQLIIYNAVYSAMLVGRFTDAAGNFTAESLRNLDAEDAAEVLSALRAMIAAGEIDDGLSQGAQQALDEIDLSEGSNDEERLRRYLETQ